MSDHKTIEDAKEEIRRAEFAEESIRELKMTEIGEYTIVDDEMDRWIAETAQIEESIEHIVDHYLTTDTSGQRDDDDITIAAYEMFCDESQCLYSRIGSPSDAAELAKNIECTDAEAAAIADELLDTDDAKKFLTAREYVVYVGSWGGASYEIVETDSFDTLAEAKKSADATPYGDWGDKYDLEVTIEMGGDEVYSVSFER